MISCDTIDSLLDDHLVARLNASERQLAADHVGGCVRCSAAWAADEALRGETIADPAPELFNALLRRISAVPAQSETPRRSRWASLAAAAAAIAVVAVAARWVVIEPEGAAPPEVSSAPSSVAQLPFVAGRDYELLPAAAARPAIPATETVEVTEFFMFFCFPCYAFEPALDRWEAQAPSDVTLTRVPALFNATAELQARAYYTAEVLDKLGAMQDAFYDEIHERGNGLASRAALANFFQRFGVDAATFDATFDSREVDALVQRAVALNREYSISATPTVVVAGRYSTNPGLAVASFTDKSAWATAMLEVVDQLVAESLVCRDRCDQARQR